MLRLLSATAAAIVLAIALFAGSASAKPFPGLIVLPGATSAEGIATGIGSTFYAGDLFAGDIYRGDLRGGTASLFVDAPNGRLATGLKVDVAHNLLVVAGFLTGQAYFYDARTGADRAILQLAGPGAIINDVALTKDAAWFTDSSQPHLYRVPIGPNGAIGTASTLVVTGPAANLSGPFNLNGIAATANGKTLLVAHSSDATIYTVNPQTGASAAIAGVNVPTVDGILLEADRLWAVQNFMNQATELRLSPDLTSATVERVFTSPDFEVPTTVARDGDRLAFVNAKFDTGLPPTATSFEVVVLQR
jgi:sugar lactone lactonase YvrE